MNRSTSTPQMMTPPSAGAPGQRLLDLSGGLLLLLLLGSAGLFLLAPFNSAHLLQAVVLYLLLALLLHVRLPPTAPGPGIGWANRVTLVRAVPVLLIAGLIGHGPWPDSLIWWVVVLAVAALLLDGVDGLVARRTGTSTAFGARFDMELDAALILLLAFLVWRTGQAPAWVLLVGLLRYGFVAAGWVLPALRQPLPESFRRKTVCVIQVIALPLCLAPIVPVQLATSVALLALALLVWSFAVDSRWLMRQGGH